MGLPHLPFLDRKFHLQGTHFGAAGPESHGCGELQGLNCTVGGTEVASFFTLMCTSLLLTKPRRLKLVWLVPRELVPTPWLQ